MSENSKRCTRCLLVKPLSRFGNCRVTKDGKTYWCKDCFNEQRRLQRNKGIGKGKYQRPKREWPDLTESQTGLIIEHLVYARKGAKRYARMAFDLGRWRATTFDDLLSAAYYGLVIAARKFMPERGVRFKTYAFWFIDRYLKIESSILALTDDIGPTRSDRGKSERLRRVEWPQNEWLLPHSFPTEEEIMGIGDDR